MKEGKEKVIKLHKNGLEELITEKINLKVFRNRNRNDNQLELNTCMLGNDRNSQYITLPWICYILMH